MSDKTTYESLDNRIAPEALTKDHTKGLAVIDGHAVKSQEDYEDPDRLYDILIARIRKYHPSTDVSLIEKAYKLAVEAHGDQRRKSGEPYIIHPLWVAIILADLEMDKETIAAGMLHDVVEDTKFTEEDIRKEFGAEVALLVDGVTKLGRLSYSSDKLEVQAENLRKMFLAMAKDIRVIIIKLADRLHNMRTLQFMTPAKQKEKAKETMDIYAPIAQRLGISKIKTELDDLALKYSQPEVFYDLEAPVKRLGTADVPLPFSPVPISFTNLAIYLAAYVLGMKACTVSYLIYMLLGMVGIPVFSGFTAGVGKLAGPTGGYLVGFILMALIVGFFVDHFPGKVALHIVGMVLGLAICYIFGTVWLAGQLNMTFVAGLGVGVIPYLPGDAVKIIFTALIGPKLRREIYRLGD